MAGKLVYQRQIVVDRDDFSGSLTGWEVQAPWQIVNGQAQLPLTPGSTNFFDLLRWPTWIGDFANTSCIVELVSASDQSNYAEFYCGMVGENDLNKQVFFDIYGNYIRTNVWNKANNGYTEVIEYPYDPIAHRWLRIRHAGGRFYFDVSPNGGAWTELYSCPVPFDISRMWFDMGGGLYLNTSASVPPIIVDNFSLVQMP